MSDAKPAQYPITDPHNVPVTFSNEVMGIGVFNGVVNVTLGVARFTPQLDGTVDPDRVVAARLRLDLPTAIVLRDQLNQQIALLTPPPSTAAN